MVINDKQPEAEQKTTEPSLLIFLMPLYRFNCRFVRFRSSFPFCFQVFS